MNPSPTRTSDSGFRHRRVAVNGTELHWVEAGSGGSPVVLVHGFPETWWAFRELIPLLAEEHRVFAVDLPGFGDSDTVDESFDSAVAAGTLHALLEELDVGPVHLSGQDISGAAVFRLAATHPESVRSFTAIEMGLPGFGLETLADVTKGGAWHIGFLAAPGIPELLLGGREREFMASYAFPSMTATPGALSDEDIDEFVRTYSRPGGMNGAIGLYRSMLREGEDIKALAAEHPLTMPVLAVGAGGGPFTENTLEQVTASTVRSVSLDGVGHYAAIEAPNRLAGALLEFYDVVDGEATSGAR